MAANTTARAQQPPPPNPPPVAVVETGEAMAEKTRRQMFALFGQKGIDEDKQLSGINAITGGSYTSRGDLTEADAKAVIAKLRTQPDTASTERRAEITAEVASLQGAEA